MSKLICDDILDSPDKSMSKEILKEHKAVKNAKEELLKSKRNSRNTILALKRSRRDKLLSAAYRVSSNTEKTSPVKRTRPSSNENRLSNTS